MNYYNEFDSKAAAWLRELINQGHIPKGDVDERSITDVKPDDLHGYIQCHFFAGIGGWSEALRLAGWPSDRRVWTGSCPCQPFSIAGQGKGKSDERHVWPEFARLIGECRPSTVFGEQVASPLGRKWLYGVFVDLEGMGYAASGADLCAASIGSPHIRQRLFWVGVSNGSGRIAGELTTEAARHGGSAESAGSISGLGNSILPRLEGHAGDGDHRNQPGREHANEDRPATETGGDSLGSWDDFDIIPCADGKSRRVESGVKPLAHGLPKGMVHSRDLLDTLNPNETQEARVMRLKGYGNAIVPQVAAVFIGEAAEAINSITP